jgi:hypothetical protein
MKTTKLLTLIVCLLVSCFITPKLRAVILPGPTPPVPVWYGLCTDTNPAGVGTGFQVSSNGFLYTVGQYAAEIDMVGYWSSNTPTFSDFATPTPDGFVWYYFTTNVPPPPSMVPMPLLVTSYTVHPWGSLFGGPVMTVAPPNDSGHMVGQEYEYNNPAAPASAFYCDGSSLRNLGSITDPPDFDHDEVSRAVWIDKHDNILGNSPTYGENGFSPSYYPGPDNTTLWIPTATNIVIRDISPTFGIPTNINEFYEGQNPDHHSYYNHGVAMNNIGQILATSSNPNANYLAFSTNGPVTNMASVTTNISVQALAMNDRGQVTGTNLGGAFLYSTNAGFTAIPSLGGGSTVPNSININGDTFGQSARSNGDLSAFMCSGGVMYDLGIPGVPASSGLIVTAWGNDYDEVLIQVGPLGVGTDKSAFYVYYRGVLQNLTNMVSYLYPIASVGGINNEGQISAILATGGGSHELALLTPMFQMWNPAISGGTNVINTAWGLNPALSCTLQEKTNLSDSAWSSVQTNPASPVALATFTLPFDATTNRFFRVSQP